MEELVPRTVIEEGHPTSGDPVIPIARPFERPGSVRAGCWRDCSFSVASMGRRPRLRLRGPGSRLAEKGPVHGARNQESGHIEGRTAPPVRARRSAPGPSILRDATRVGAVSGRARNLPPAAPALRAVDGAARSLAGDLQDLPDRGSRLPGAGDPGALRPACSLPGPLLAGRSPCSWPSRSAGLFWVFGTEVAAIVLGLSAVLIGRLLPADLLDRPRRRLWPLLGAVLACRAAGT